MQMNLPNYRDAGDVLELMPDTSFFIHAQIFDDLLIVANRVTAAFVLKTRAGLILIDAIYPKQEMFNAITGAIRDIGWDPEEIRKFVLTHGHFDHCGCGKWIKNAFHPETCLSRTDTLYWQEHPFFPDKPETWKDFDIDCYIDDGDEIRLGDTVMQVLSTPGHTPGGLSYIFSGA
jgi:metallo-beta-lactamase class B